MSILESPKDPGSSRRGGYLYNAGKGALIGALMGLGAEFKSTHFGHPADLVGVVIFGAVIGATASILLRWTWPLRQRGVSGYYAGWVFSLAVPATILGACQFLRDGDLRFFGFAVLAGIGAGFGIGKFVRPRNDSRESDS
jgi:hypothetical protein